MLFHKGMFILAATPCLVLAQLHIVPGQQIQQAQCQHQERVIVETVMACTDEYICAGGGTHTCSYQRAALAQQCSNCANVSNYLYDGPCPHGVHTNKPACNIHR
jgi:hypothetical protein